MLMKTLAKAALAALLTLSLVPGLAHAGQAGKLSSAWMGEHETFIAWYAKQQGWDKEAGFDLAMMPFESGKGIVESLSAYNWAVAGIGSVPAMTAPLSDYLYIIAVANDESLTNAVYVRKDSPILAAKGSPAYPGTHGSAGTVHKAEILYPKGTSAHYTLAAWLKSLGLSESDVRLTDMEPTAALGAFTGGVGSAVALWAPLTYEAEARGFQPAATSRDCGLNLYVLLVANRDFADKHPEQVSAFLKMYLRGVEAMRKTPVEELAKDYVRFYKEWTGRALAPEKAALDLRQHPVFTLEEQLALFDPAAPNSLQKNLDRIADFAIRQGTFVPEQIDKLKAGTRVTDRFLRNIR